MARLEAMQVEQVQVGLVARPDGRARRVVHARRPRGAVRSMHERATGLERDPTGRTEHEQLPDSGFRFSAVPPKIRGMGTFPVRAYATIGLER